MADTCPAACARCRNRTDAAPPEYRRPNCAGLCARGRDSSRRTAVQSASLALLDLERTRCRLIARSCRKEQRARDRSSDSSPDEGAEIFWSRQTSLNPRAPDDLLSCDGRDPSRVAGSFFGPIEPKSGRPALRPCTNPLRGRCLQVSASVAIFAVEGSRVELGA